MATNNRQSYNPQIDPKVDRRVVRHFQELYQSANDHDQAIILLNTKVTALQNAKTTTTTTTTTSSSSSSSTTGNFPGLGYVDVQTGIAAYTLQSSDSGAMVEVGFSSAVTVTLNNLITSPFFCFITNFGPTTATLTATSPQTVNGGATYAIAPNQLCMLVFYGSNWYASAYPLPGTFAYTAVSATYAVQTLDYQIECTANSFTVTLPTAVGISGKTYSIKNSGTGQITVATTSAQTIDGQLTQILSQWSNIVVMSNGTGWIIL